jgi:hypothetical protein
LLDYCDRKLSADLMDEMDRHLAVCVSCRDAVAGQRAVWEALEAWQPEPVSADFDCRLYRQIDSVHAQPWWKRLLSLPSLSWKPAMPLAAACMLLLGVLIFRPASTTGPAAQGEKIDVEQVESALDDMDMFRQLGIQTQQQEDQSRQAL